VGVKMSFEVVAKLLFSLIQARAVQNFLRKKNIFLTWDRTKQTFILHATVFSENQYVSPKIREFIFEKKFSSEWKTFLKVSEKTSEVYLVRHIPSFQRNIPWRNIFIDFCEEAESHIIQLRKAAESEFLFLENNEKSQDYFS
jgi:hypothetical protein